MRDWTNSELKKISLKNVRTLKHFWKLFSRLSICPTDPQIHTRIPGSISAEGFTILNK